MVMSEGGYSLENVIFTATSGRTGTTTLVDVFEQNLSHCIACHEPKYQFQGLYERLYLTLRIRHRGHLEQSGFGQALRWYDCDDPALTLLAGGRASCIRKLECRNYLESSHAFLSSLCDAMVKEFPSLGLIHLTRDPLEVAVSYCNRNKNPPDSPEFVNALSRWHPHPNSRKNCLPLPDGQLTKIQYYLWVWIESELRCLRFLECYPDIRCFHLDTQELNVPERIAALFNFFGITTDEEQITIPSARNRNHAETYVSEQVIAEAKSLLCRIDPQILQKLPYPYSLVDLVNER